MLAVDLKFQTRAFIDLTVAAFGTEPINLDKSRKATRAQKSTREGIGRALEDTKNDDMVHPHRYAANGLNDEDDDDDDDVGVKNVVRLGRGRRGRARGDLSGPGLPPVH